MLKTWNDQSPDFRSDDDPGDQHCEQGASARTARVQGGDKPGQWSAGVLLSAAV